jgi:predicted component of type VI protein secretion system
MHVSLKVTEGKQAGTLIPLNRNKFLIGREEDCQLRPNSDLVSRHHCVFSTDDFTVRIRDLGSTNGTFVNNHRITGQVVLKQGDQVRIGKLAFEIQIRQDAPPVAPQAKEPIAIDYSQGLPSASETLADFAIPQHMLDQGHTDVQTRMFSGETTVVNQIPGGAPIRPPRPTPPPVPLRLPESAQAAGAVPPDGSAGAAPPNSSAADIIRQYMQRKPQ